MDPKTEYTARMGRFRAEENLLKKRFVQIGNWRLVIGILTAVLAWFVFADKTVTAFSLLIPLALFAGLVIWHARVTRKRAKAGRAASYYEQGLLRLEDKWAGHGLSGEQYREASHVYADDLDVFGKGSLFELIAITRTKPGQEMLAQWLLAPASAAEVSARQQAVGELAPNISQREEIALLAGDIEPDAKMKSPGLWGELPNVTFPAWLRPLALVLAVAGLISIVGVFGHFVPVWALLTLLAVDFVLILVFRDRVRQVLENVEASARDLHVLAAITAYLERQSFASARLTELTGALKASGQPASKRISQLGRLVDWLDSSDHIFVRALRPVVLWDEQLAISFENWRRTSGQQIGRWVQAVAEFEALSSFAALSFERPDWSRAELLGSSKAKFVSVDLRHPCCHARSVFRTMWP